MATIDPNCDRCDDTGLDPDRYIEDHSGDTLVWYHAPCDDCRPDDER